MARRLIFFLPVFFILMATVAAGDEKPRGILIRDFGENGLGYHGKYVLLGRTHEPVGNPVTVQGIAVKPGEPKNREYDGPRMKVRRINGRPTQEDIELNLKPFRTGFGEPYYVISGDTGNGLTDHLKRELDPERSLPKLQYGKAYEFVGYETVRFAHIPIEALAEPRLPYPQTGDGENVEFIVFKGKQLNPLVLTPGRETESRITP